MRIPFLPTVQAIAKAISEDWNWTGTRVNLQAPSPKSSNPHVKIDIRLERFDAMVGFHCAVLLELKGHSEQTEFARVRYIRLNGEARGDSGWTALNLPLTRKPSKAVIKEVAALLNQAHAGRKAWRVEDRIQSVAECLVRAALDRLEGTANAVVCGLHKAQATMLLVAADRSALSASAEALGNLLHLKLETRIRAIEDAWSDDAPDPPSHLPACRIDADQLEKFEVKKASDKIVLALAHNASVVITASHTQIPAPLKAHVDATIAIPRLEGALFARCFEAAFGTPLSDLVGDGDSRWSSLVTLDDLRAVLRSGARGEAALERLRTVASRRLRSATVENARPLASLHGLGQAREWAETVIREMRLAAAGELGWEDVDRGALVYGPPGTGKTALARAIAGECSMPFLATSAARWIGNSHLGEVLKNMRSDFEHARQTAPSFLFLDEIDAFGSREKMRGEYRQWYVEVINALLAELDGFHPRTGVVVIGATNYLSDVDPALVRPGRLDRVVRMPLPDAEALAAIYQDYLGDWRGPDVDLGELARLSAGLAGAQIEFVVRCARRRARRRNSRAIGMAELRRELIEVLFGSANEGAGVDAASIKRVAVHEGGHAIVMLLGPDRGASIGFVSVTSRGMGLGGTIGHQSGPDHLTREDLLAKVRILLAGRAAEATVYGPDDVSLGAGGPSESDLARATALGVLIETAFGIGSDAPLLWLGPINDPIAAADVLRRDKSLAARVAALLDGEYAITMTLIERHRDLLDRVINLLIEEREVDGRRIRALLDQDSGPTPSSALPVYLRRPVDRVGDFR
jgi:ATP-dependent Zn protease